MERWSFREFVMFAERLTSIRKLSLSSTIVLLRNDPEEVQEAVKKNICNNPTSSKTKTID
jgi:hypothetical protein